MTRRAQSLRLEEFFICNFNREEFTNALLGLQSDVIRQKIKEFNALSLFQKDAFKVLQERFIDKLAHGPERKQVCLKQPDAAIYFVHLNNQNVSNAVR